MRCHSRRISSVNGRIRPANHGFSVLSSQIATSVRSIASHRSSAWCRIAAIMAVLRKKDSRGWALDQDATPGSAEGFRSSRRTEVSRSQPFTLLAAPVEPLWSRRPVCHAAQWRPGEEPVQGRGDFAGGEPLEFGSGNDYDRVPAVDRHGLRPARASEPHDLAEAGFGLAEGPSGSGRAGFGSRQGWVFHDGWFSGRKILTNIVIIECERGGISLLFTASRLARG